MTALVTCKKECDIGKKAFVPHTADYVFYKKYSPPTRRAADWDQSAWRTRAP